MATTQGISQEGQCSGTSRIEEGPVTAWGSSHILKDSPGLFLAAKSHGKISPSYSNTLWRGRGPQLL